MAQATLYEAMYSFHERYKDALAKNSRRLVQRLDQDWQTINNNWDLYLQAKAEGNEIGANTAIQEIVVILGGDIDVSVLPDIAGAETEVDGVVSVIPGLQKITFTLDLGTTNYRLTLNIYDGSGVPIGYTLGAKESDGFNINPSFNATLEYNAKVIV